jgi:hypothetical protein
LWVVEALPNDFIEHMFDFSRSIQQWVGHCPTACEHTEMNR